MTVDLFTLGRYVVCIIMHDTPLLPFRDLYIPWNQFRTVYVEFLDTRSRHSTLTTLYPALGHLVILRFPPVVFGRLARVYGRPLPPSSHKVTEPDIS